MLLVVLAACGPQVQDAAPDVTSSLPTALAETSTPQRLHAVILDFSPTVSDMGALAFLATHPDVFLMAVTLAGTGETACEPGVAMTLGVLTFLGREDVPVACGQPDPIDGQNAFPDSWRLSPSDLGVQLGVPTDQRSASELIIELVRASPLPVDIVAVGPLTNLAVAFAVDPELPSMVGGITIMGGAIDVPGTAGNELAEWNIWVDPVAASDVIRSGSPITLVPLDVTNRVPTGSVFFEALDQHSDAAAARFIRDLWLAQGEWAANRDGYYYFWDELAAAFLVDESLFTTVTRSLTVEISDPLAQGRTLPDATGSPVRVVTAVRRLAFEQLLLETLVGGPAELDY